MREADRLSPELEYLIRRFTLEKGYAVLADELENGSPVLRGLDPSRFGYSVPVRSFAELQPLYACFDLILFRMGARGLAVIGVKTYASVRPFKELDPQELLAVREAGLASHPVKAWLIRQGAQADLSNQIFMKLSSIEMQVNGQPPLDRERLTDLCHRFSPKNDKMAFNAYALDFAAGKAQGVKGGILMMRYLKRILAKKDEPESRMIKVATKTGVELLPMLVGAGLGVIPAIWVTILSAQFGRHAITPRTEFVFYLLGFVFAIFVGVEGRRSRKRSAWQVACNVLLFSVLYLGYSVLFTDFFPVFWWRYWSFLLGIGPLAIVAGVAACLMGKDKDGF